MGRSREGHRVNGELPGEVSTGTGLERQTEEKGWFVPRWRDTYKQRLHGKTSNGVSWGKEETNLSAV